MQLDDDRGLVKQLGTQARERAERHFDERLVIDRTLEVYAELLASPFPARSAVAG